MLPTEAAAGSAMSHEIACHACDLLVNVDDLHHGQSAVCPRCGSFLTKLRTDRYERAMALASAGLILLVIGCSFPFLSFSASGLESVMTLPQTPGTIWEYGMPGVAILVAAFIIVIPAAILVLVLLLSWSLSTGRNVQGLVQVARWVFLWQNWSMVEVFIIGVIVSLVKIAAMATVVLGISFWAYTGFTICFTAACLSLDRFRCWEDIEALTSHG